MVLWLFLGNLRAAAIVALIIPLALLATFIGLQLRGISANLLSLGAMDFGIIVDGAVIVMENIFRRLADEQHRRGHPATPANAARPSSRPPIQVGRPTFFSMLIIITAYVPIFALQRHEGRIFAPMAYTIISALIGSLVFSLTLVPLLAQWSLRGRIAEGDNLLVRGAKALYRPVARLVAALPQERAGRPRWPRCSRPWRPVPWLGTEFLPELNEGSIWLNINLPPSISLTETKAACARIRAIVGGFSEVTSVVSKAGRPEDGTDPKMLNMTETFVGLKPRDQWPPGMTREKLIAAMGKALDALPGHGRQLLAADPRQRPGEHLADRRADRHQAVRRRRRACCRPSPRRSWRWSGRSAASPRRPSTAPARCPQLEIAIDRARASRYGLNVADVEDVIEATLGGKVCSELWEGDRRFDVAVRLPERERNDLDQIRTIAVQTPAGHRGAAGGCRRHRHHQAARSTSATRTASA